MLFVVASDGDYRTWFVLDPSYDKQNTLRLTVTIRLRSNACARDSRRSLAVFKVCLSPPEPNEYELYYSYLYFLRHTSTP